jgi:hypothetical protein
LERAFFASAIILSLEERKKLGFSIDEFVLRCHFINVQCSLKSDFIHLFHPYYGNCFQFKNFTNVTDSGVKAGLSIELFVGGQNGIDLSPHKSSVGFQVFIQNAEELSIIGEGIEIPVNMNTNVMITRNTVEFLGRPYSDCIEDNIVTLRERLEDDIATYLTSNHFSYDRLVCQQLYIQKSVNEECNCSTSQLLNIYNSSYCFEPQQISCAESSLNKSVTTKLVREICPESCVNHQIETILAYGSFPSESYGNLLRNHPKVVNKFTNNQSIEEPLPVASFKVYYSDLQTVITKEIPLIDKTNVVSTIGGTLGLFLGLSVLGFIEIFITILHLIIISLKKFI